jgi:hypothetical protein
MAPPSDGFPDDAERRKYLNAELAKILNHLERLRLEKTVASGRFGTSSKETSSINSEIQRAKAVQAELKLKIIKLKQGEPTTIDSSEYLRSISSFIDASTEARQTSKAVSKEQKDLKITKQRVDDAARNLGEAQLENAEASNKINGRLLLGLVTAISGGNYWFLLGDKSPPLIAIGLSICSLIFVLMAANEIFQFHQHSGATHRESSKNIELASESARSKLDSALAKDANSRRALHEEESNSAFQQRQLIVWATALLIGAIVITILDIHIIPVKIQFY